MPIKLSWTRYQTFKNCPLQYTLTYLQRVRAIKPRLPFLAGAVVHKSIEAWAKAGYPTNYIDKVAANLFRSRASTMRFNSKATYIKLLRRSVLGAAMAAHIYRLLRVPEHEALVEEWFSLPFGDQGDQFIGGIDVYDPVTEHMYDMKLHSDSSNAFDQEQVLTYAVAQLLRDRPLKRVGVISPLRTVKVETKPISISDIQNHKAKLLEAVARMRAGVAPTPTVGRHCHICGYKNTLHCVVGRRLRSQEGWEIGFTGDA